MADSSTESEIGARDTLLPKLIRTPVVCSTAHTLFPTPTKAQAKGLGLLSHDPTLTPGGSTREQIITSTAVSAVLIAPRGPTVIILALFKNIYPVVFTALQKQKKRAALVLFCQTTAAS